MNDERFMELLRDRMDGNRPGLIDLCLVPDELLRRVAHTALCQRFFGETQLRVTFDFDVDCEGRVVRIDFISDLSRSVYVLCPGLPWGENDVWYAIYKSEEWLNVVRFGHESDGLLAPEVYEAVLVFAGMHPCPPEATS